MIVLGGYKIRGFKGGKKGVLNINLIHHYFTLTEWSKLLFIHVFLNVSRSFLSIFLQ